MEKIIYGKSIIEFSISYSDRKTLGITVNPDLSVNIKAPLNSKKEDIFKIVEKRVPWILEQKRFSFF